MVDPKQRVRGAADYHPLLLAEKLPAGVIGAAQIARGTDDTVDWTGQSPGGRRQGWAKNIRR